MNRCKKIAILVCACLTALNVVACGQVKGDKVVNTDESPTRQQDSSVQTIEDTDLEIKEDETANVDKSSVNQQESSMQIDENTNLETEEDKTISVEESNAQTSENIGTEMTTEEILDLFINGSISAISSEDSAFYITDLDMDSGEWDSYSIGERVDLDNDGENELIICGPYGGIYLDARNNKVYEFAVGEGDALVLSYVVYNGSTWIMHSNRMNTGYEAYHMEKFEGADNLVAEMNFYEELVDEDNVEGKEKYTLNGTEISYDEYFELCSKIFATEEITTK